jgi:hypothetical protein
MQYDRRNLSTKELLTFITILINISALVWGAAKISATVDNLNESVVDLRATTRKLVSDIAEIKIDYNARLEVLESKNNIQPRGNP